jgi:predicted transposase/invertase (TIGR01784 family)
MEVEPALRIDIKFIDVKIAVMKRDHIFYTIFKRNPSLLFELVNEQPPGAKNYKFDSIEVKETAFRIDGVFLPPANVKPKIVYFAEIQFQPDEDLHHRFFSELTIIFTATKVVMMTGVEF